MTPIFHQASFNINEHARGIRFEYPRFRIAVLLRDGVVASDTCAFPDGLVGALVISQDSPGAAGRGRLINAGQLVQGLLTHATQERQELLWLFS